MEIPKTRAGITMYLIRPTKFTIVGSVRPPTGSHSSFRAKIKIAHTPKKNCGIETPSIPATVRTLSPMLPLLIAPKTPRMLPRIVEIHKAATASSRVAGSRSAIIWITGTPLEELKPKSPCKTRPSHFK